MFKGVEGGIDEDLFGEERETDFLGKLVIKTDYEQENVNKESFFAGKAIGDKIIADDGVAIYSQEGQD